MTDVQLAALLADVLDAHGGLVRWNTYAHVEAKLVSHGLLYDLKGERADRCARHVSVGLRQVQTIVQPFGAADRKLTFTADRTAIEKVDGSVVAAGLDVRAGFAGHGVTTPWTPLQRAYFSGYALWGYLNSPFLLTLPGVHLHPVAPVEHDGHVLVGIGADLPAALPAHSRRQWFYFDSQRLLRRHDYRVDIAGAFPASQYLTDYTVVDGFAVALTRRAYRTDDGSDVPMVAMYFSDVAFRQDRAPEQRCQFA